MPHEGKGDVAMQPGTITAAVLRIARWLISQMAEKWIEHLIF